AAEEWKLAQEAYTASLAIKRELGDRVRECSELADIASCQREMGLFSECRSKLEAALRLARELKDRPHEAMILGRFGLLEIQIGHPRDAMKFLEDSLKMHRELRNADDIRVQESNIALLLGKRGELDKARAIYEKHLESARVAGRTGDEISALLDVG